MRLHCRVLRNTVSGCLRLTPTNILSALAHIKPAMTTSDKSHENYCLLGLETEPFGEQQNPFSAHRTIETLYIKKTVTDRALLRRGNTCER